MSDIFTVSMLIPDPGADNKAIFLYRAPTDGLGGGVRILNAYAVTANAMSAGTSFSFALHKYSSAGTPAVNGTIAAAIGGTAATVWAAGVPQAFTIDADYSFLDAGEWLVLDYQEDQTGNPTNAVVTVNLAMGK